MMHLHFINLLCMMAIERPIQPLLARSVCIQALQNTRYNMVRNLL